MTTLKKIIHWIFTVLPMIITAAFMPFMEEKVPIHYDINNKVDGYGSKYTYFVISVFMALILVVIRIVIAYYQKKKYDEDKDRVHALYNTKVLYGLGIFLGIFESVLLTAMLIKAYNIASGSSYNLDTNKIVVIAFGIVIILLGNLMPKTKMNGGLGIRTVWSMTNDATWAASNRAGGIIMVIGGFFAVLLGILTKGSEALIGFIILLLLISFFCILFSYIAYKKYK